MATKHLRSDRRLAAVLAFGLASMPIAAQAVVPYPSDAVGPLVPETLPNGFIASTVAVGGINLHYVRGGTGPTTLILLYDWPETGTLGARSCQRLQTDGRSSLPICAASVPRPQPPPAMTPRRSPRTSAAS